MLILNLRHANSQKKQTKKQTKRPMFTLCN